MYLVRGIEAQHLTDPGDGDVALLPSIGERKSYPYPP